MRRLFWIGIWLAVVLSLAGCGAKMLHVQDAWARPANAGSNGAAYFTIQNPGKTEDALLSASASIAQAAELHLSSMNSEGTMTMQPQASVAVPAGEDVAFKPGGLHVMLVNLQRDLKIGDAFQLELEFQNAGTQIITVEVKEP